MDLYLSPYQLIRRAGQKIQNGVLIKLCEGPHWGVADLCPHLHLGDLTVEQEIKNKGLLFKRAYDLAQEDLIARREKKSLLRPIFIQNNILVSTQDSIEKINQINLKHVLKIKCNDNIEKTLRFIEGIPLSIQLRLDFNSRLNSEQFSFFLQQLTQDQIKRIEYIEDPTLYNSNWIQWNKMVPLATDFQKPPAGERSHFVNIIKPSREVLVKNGKYTVLTSAMEHPVGLAHALRLAQQEYDMSQIYGFSTLDYYEDNGFNQYFQIDDHRISFSHQALADYGIGMTTQLSQLSWKKVSEIFS